MPLDPPDVPGGLLYDTGEGFGTFLAPLLHRLEPQRLGYLRYDFLASFHVSSLRLGSSRGYASPAKSVKDVVV